LQSTSGAPTVDQEIANEQGAPVTDNEPIVETIVLARNEEFHYPQGSATGGKTLADDDSASSLVPVEELMGRTLPSPLSERARGKLPQRVTPSSNPPFPGPSHVRSLTPDADVDRRSPSLATVFAIDRLGSAQDQNEQLVASLNQPNEEKDKNIEQLGSRISRLTSSVDQDLNTDPARASHQLHENIETIRQLEEDLSNLKRQMREEVDRLSADLENEKSKNKTLVEVVRNLTALLPY